MLPAVLTALGLLGVLGLILANGWFVAAEFAYVAARKGRLEEARDSGDQRAQRALDILGRLSFMLSGAQLGITVTSLLVGFIAEPTLGRAIAPLLAPLGLADSATRSLSLTLGFVLATAAQMVLGELAPKNLAIALPETFALALARSTALYTAVAGPIIRLFDNAANRLLRIIGVQPVDEIGAVVSPEELELIVEESGREGALSPAQAALLQRTLDFRSLRAADVMVPRRNVVFLRHDATCEDLRTAAIDSGHSRFPVIGQDLDDVHGVVQAKDLLGVPVEARATTPVSRLATEGLAVPESAMVGPLLAELRAAHTPLAVVVDEFGGTAGVLTLEDIVEELVGEIQDEYDPAEPAVEAAGDGAFLVPGSWRIDEVARDTGLDLPPGDYDSLGGLVTERLGRIPRPGDQVDIGGATLRVEDVDGLAVGRVRVAQAPGDAGGAMPDSRPDSRPDSLPDTPPDDPPDDPPDAGRDPRRS